MSHGKIVMLVDNTVDGDSRVQKSARSAADAGWDVTLIGRAPGNQQVTSKLGNATLLRVPVTFTLDSRSRVLPRRLPLRFLAYPNRDVMAIRSAQIDWALLDLRTRKASGTAKLSTPISQAWWRGRHALHRVRRREYTRATSTKVAKQAKQQAKQQANQTLQALQAKGRSGDDRQWRRNDTRLADYELAMGPVIEKLAPDLIHAHDFRMIGIAARAAERIGQTRPRPKVVYDAHEYLPGVGFDNQRMARALEAYERTYIKRVDAVVTVSDAIADQLVSEHGLPERPIVVLNTPVIGPDGIPIPASDVRADSKLDAKTPLMVYVGVSAAKRGLGTMVDALPHLPGVHFTLVTKANDFVTALRTRASELEVADRLHVLPYVDPDDVPGYARTATVGVHGLIHLPNHELTLPTKLYEYAHARLPVVVSDVASTAKVVTDNGIGEVYPVGDVDGFVTAVRRVIDDPEHYRSAYDRPGLLESWTWQAQVAPVHELYKRLLVSPSESVA